MLMEHLNMLTGGELWHFLQRVEIFPNGEKFYYSQGGARIALTGTCLLPIACCLLPPPVPLLPHPSSLLCGLCEADRGKSGTGRRGKSGTGRRGKTRDREARNEARHQTAPRVPGTRVRMTRV